MAKGMEMLAETIRKMIPPEALAQIETAIRTIPEFAAGAQALLQEINQRLNGIETKQEYIIQLLTGGAGEGTVQKLIDSSKDIIAEMTRVSDESEIEEEHGV